MLAKYWGTICSPLRVNWEAFRPLPSMCWQCDVVHLAYLRDNFLARSDTS